VSKLERVKVRVPINTYKSFWDKTTKPVKKKRIKESQRKEIEEIVEGKWLLEPNSYVIVKRTGIKKKWRDPVKRKDKFNNYLGYIGPGKNGKPRKFHVYTGNPLEDKWRNKIACKSYKPESEGE
jgi:hypothetical protein